MVGSDEISFWGPADFQGRTAFAVTLRECRFFHFAVADFDWPGLILLRGLFEILIPMERFVSTCCFNEL